MEDDSIDPDIDPTLQNLVDIINEVGTQMGLTLSVGGLIISGTTISHREWTSSSGDALRGSNTNDPDFTQALGDALTTSGINPFPDEPQPKPRMVHLKDATIYGAATYPVPLPRWRGKISSVDGWEFGALSGR